MQYDPHALENKLTDPDTKYIIVYPDTGIDIGSFIHDLRALLARHHGRGQGWTIGSNIEIDGQPLIGEPEERQDTGI